MTEQQRIVEEAIRDLTMIIQPIEHGAAEQAFRKLRQAVADIPRDGSQTAPEYSAMRQPGTK